MRRNEKKYMNMGIVWVCPNCGAYNLSEIGWGDFICIACSYHIHAEAQGEIVEDRR